jgi:glycopeptide antibiotics resistance protein
MNQLLKKFLVFLPVIVLGFFYLHDHSASYHHVKGKRLILRALSLFFLYGWIFLEVMLRKQRSFLQIATQAGFYVYIFMVLTLTGYFILFREISVHGWWHKMMVRVDHRDHVNLELFKMFKIYKLASKQVIGNFIMLMPLGFFLPLLYKRISNLFLVLLTALLVSTVIELLQLITSFRSADVDDIFLNTLGACTGFVLFKIISFTIKPTVQTAPVAAS